MPMRILNDTFVEMLEELTSLASYQWQKEKESKEAGTWHEQETFNFDDDIKWEEDE